MKEDLHDIDKLFQSAINEHQEMPSDEVWNNLEKNLDKNDIIDFRKKNSGLKRLSVLLLLLLSGISVYLLLNTQKDKPVSSNQITTTPNDPVADQSQKNIAAKKNTADILKDKLIAKKTIEKADVAEAKNSSSLETNNTANAATGKAISDQNKTTATLKRSSKNNPVKNKNISGNINKSRKTTTKKASVKISTNKATDNFDGDEDRELSSAVDETNISTNKEIKDSSTIESNKATSLAVAATKPTEVGKTSPAKKKDQKKKETDFALNFFYSPDFAFYRLQNDENNNQQSGENEDEFNDNEEHGNAFTGGILFDYNLNDHWTIQSGIVFSKTTIRSDEKKIYAQTDNSGNIKYRYNASSGYTFVNAPEGNAPSVGDSIEASSALHTIKYIGVPLALKYTLSYKKWELNMSAGATANFLINGKIQTSLEGSGDDDDHDKKYKLQGLKKTYFSGSASIGAAYNLNKQWAITFNPTVRFALSAINKNVSVRSYPNSFGLSTGLRFKF
ncbi:outer membrane beta-barrel protein [Ferruginibacter sp. SUN002]|uniref:outer membrane beta-barrel protein n=1 Tax=Ferruginibacter sp. SUN002 TaxID=2937789 RepID=UPI003D36AC9E